MAATDNWKPIAYTSVGSIARSRSTAPPRIAGGLRGRPRKMPSIARPDMIAARRTEGSARVSSTKNAMAPSPTRNRLLGPSRSNMASARTGARNMATFSPDTAVR